ncbi:MAG TPA: thioesterase family protein [Vicinamibacteria bacterium]|nr:thioesterase family protein [Vicinamibacteria bacterium]
MSQTTCQIRVRYAETDSMGVVYYGNYLTWFEVGRADLLRQLGQSYRDIEESEGIRLPVVEARCRYHRPARYDDVVSIVTRASRPSRAQVQFDYELSRAEDGVLLASGSTRHVAVGRNGKPCRLPQRLEGLLS